MPQSQRLIILLLLANLCNYAIKAQTQADNWYFGNNAGMNFKKFGGYHVGYPIFNGQFTSQEGGASISDTSGNLLFYTDGVTVWDSTHSIMPNGTGLFGSTNSTQSTLIVQKPLSSNIFYIITTASHLSSNGIRWTEVDLNLNGGFGDVTANKNILLYNSATEKIAGLKHCNKKDVWIITHDWNNNNFQSYLITSIGISTTPVISSSGNVHSGNSLNKKGQMKVSMDGKKIACAVLNSQFIELHDFDNTTGIVSNGYVISNTMDDFYGVEFSITGKRLYGSSLSTGKLYQWDICAGSDVAIKNSQFEVSNISMNAGALQLGPDGKIYRAKNNSSYIDFIEYPDNLGSTCKYNVNAIALWTGMTSTFSLPNFVVDYIRPAVKIWYNYIPPACMTAQFFFSAPSGVNCSGPFNNILSFYWDFGDPASGANNTSTLANPIHAFSAPGGYTVSLVLTYDCVIDTVSIQVLATNFCTPQGVPPPPTVIDLTVGHCLGDSIYLPLNLLTTFSGPPPHYVAWVPWYGTGANIYLPPNTTPIPIAVVIDNNGTGTIYNFDVVQAELKLDVSDSTNCTGSFICFEVIKGISATINSPVSLSVGTTKTCVPIAPGSYFYQGVSPQGCIDTGTVIINLPTGFPNISLTTTNVSCYGAMDGIADASLTTGGNGNYTFAWSNGGTGSTISNLLPGQHSVTVTSNGCSDSLNFTITEPPPIMFNFSNIIDPSCFGASDGSLDVLASGGVPPLTYSWSNGGNSNYINNLTAGIYDLTITDANGCDSTFSFTLFDPPAILSQIQSTPASCSGVSNGTATIVATGGVPPYTYSWSNGITSDINPNLPPGIYYVTITDANNCTMTDSVVVGQLNILIPVIDILTDASCNGASDGTASISATGGTAPYNYLWPNGNTNNFDNNLSANSYTVLVTDFNGCNSTITVTINEPPVYLLSATNLINVSCFAGTDGSATVQVSAGVQPVNYLWSNGNIGATQSGLSANSYMVTATDAVGCSATTTITINEPNQLIASVLNSNNISCYGASDGNIVATGTGGIVPYSYNWSNGLTGSTIDSLSPGSYTVVITDNNNCTSTALFTITEPDQLVSTISSSTDVICFGGNDGAATVTCTGGISPYNYSWSSGSSNSSATALQQGVYIVTITDANGCLSTASVQITEPPQLVSLTFSISETCGNSNGSASVTATGGVGVYSYLWTGGDTTALITNLTAGNYTVTVTDANGCTINSSIGVSNIPGATLNILSQQDVVCNSECNGSITVSASAGTLPYNYSWTSIPGNNSPSATGLCAGNYDVSVIDSNGCVTTLNVTINEPLPLITSVSPDMFICVGDSATISATSIGGTPGYSYIWNPGNINSNSILVAPLNSTSYIVNTTDANGCEAVSSSVTVNVVPLPVIEFKSDITEGCQPLCVSFTNLTPLTSICQWDFSGGTTMLGDNVINCFNEAGFYDVSIHVTDTFGCNNTLSLDDYITVYPKPEANFNVSPLYSNILEPDFYFTDISTNAIEWLWNFGDPQESSSINQNTYFTYKDTGVFHVTLIITNDFGCKDTVVKEVLVEELFSLFIPSAFTPGEINPVFKPVIALQDLENYNFKIMNRWGEIIYNTSNLYEGWDGSKSGRFLPEGVYVYIVEAQHRNKIIKRIGNVTLLR